MEAALGAVLGAVKGPVDAVFQPHLYSRTAMLFKEMAGALSRARNVWILPVYPSREQPIPGVSSELIIGASGGRYRSAGQDNIAGIIEATDAAALLFMGAGSVDGWVRAALRGLS